MIYGENGIQTQKYIGEEIREIEAPVIKLINEDVEVTENELRNIVKIKDVPSQLGMDAMLIKECEKINEKFDVKEFKTMKWKNKFEHRKKIISPKLKIDIDEFYNFQKNKKNESIEFNSVDKIANRYGYDLLLPKYNYNLNNEKSREILRDVLLYIDSPILDIVDREETIKILYELEPETIIYLIEINIWLEEYRVKIK